MTETFLDDRVTLHHGDSREVLRGIPDASIHSVVCDPPYALVSIVKRFANSPRNERTENQENPYGRTGRGFMGQAWDTGETAFAVEFWAEVFRVLKPGGHVVAFSGTRTYHRMVVAIEDAGFEIRDQLAWVYGSGFPKSHDVSKGIDKAAGAERAKVRVDAASVGNLKARQDTRPFIEAARERGYHEVDGNEPATDAAREWQGWGTALKPSWEPIVLARKPLVGTVAANVLAHGTGGLNVDGCRVGAAAGDLREMPASFGPNEVYGKLDYNDGAVWKPSDAGRWPANIVHDGSAEVVGAFPSESGGSTVSRSGSKSVGIWSESTGLPAGPQYADSGSAARFFYSAKADAHDRIGSKHPTVKPVDLMQWLCRLVTPPGGVVLDPFAGSGTTGEAAWREGFRAILVERESAYCDDIRRRLRLAATGPEERKRESIKAAGKTAPVDGLPLFSPER